MRPVSHIIVSLGTAVFIYARFQSLAAAVICFLSGIFLDLDHIPEYLALRGKSIGLKDFYFSKLANEKQKIYLIFHSYEFTFLLWLAIQAFNLSIVWIAVAIGMSTHLILDQVQNPIRSPYTYFLAYRVIKKFCSKELFHSLKGQD